VREALTNFAKHSGATEAWLRLRMEGAVFQLTLEDNGRGFDPTAAAAGDRNGLGNMRSRLEELHGALEIHTAPGGGTRIVMRVPTKL
jgi:signal transduction histidine kinase